MNASEGLRRLALAIRYGSYGLGALVFAGAVVAGFGSVSMQPGAGLNFSTAAAGAVAGAIGGALCAGVGHAISWVLLGFSEKR